MIRSAKIICNALTMAAVFSLSACNVAENSSASLTAGDGIMADQSIAVVGASKIPYPVYPNGTKYRVGGENGLKIVVFETNDPFEDVDNFYNGEIQDGGMARLTAMNDYVRYGEAGTNSDPWATNKPGIVIHRFESDAERQAVGADSSATTNIIISF